MQRKQEETQTCPIEQHIEGSESIYLLSALPLSTISWAFSLARRSGIKDSHCMVLIGFKGPYSAYH